MKTPDIAVEVQKALRRAAKFDQFLIDLQKLIDRYQGVKTVGRITRKKKKKTIKRRAKLSRDEVVAIRAQARSGLATKDIAKNFNIHQTTTNSIIKGRLHPNVR
jgi:predicted DNA-binding protein (UPF0251 family)